jgi:hypothetical protein
VHHFELELVLEQLHAEVLQRAGARRRVVELARVGASLAQQLLQRRGGERLRHGQRQPAGRHGAERREARDRVEPLRLGQTGRERQRRSGLKQRVAVGRRVGDGLGAEIPARAGLVVDDDRLARPLGELLADGAGNRVEAAARRVGDDDRDAARRVGLGRGGEACSEDQQTGETYDTPADHEMLRSIPASDPF